LVHDRIAGYGDRGGVQPDRSGGMRERAELIGARLAIQSAPGTGTTIELQMPL
jgi:signal transduction histidine kinase